MRSTWRSTFPIVLLTFTLAVTGRATAGVVGLPAWDVVQTPDTGTEASEFRGVQVLSSSEVWAVGRRGNSTLTERWDGSSFSIVPSPNAANRKNVLEDVDGTGSTDLWAVGHADSIDFVGSRTFILHWNGSAWSRVPSPNRGVSTDQNVLTGVAAITPTDAWAVGFFQTTDPTKAAALTYHWNGTAWMSVPNPCAPFLRDVFALSSTNVWAVGGAVSCRWNGSSWKRIPIAPPITDVSVDLQDVSGTASNDLWAVGIGSSSCGEGQVCYSGVIEHWNGTAWMFVGGGPVLYGVHALAASDVYAVGQGIGPAVLHYDGSGWSNVPQPWPPPPGQLFAVDAVSASTLWAIGIIPGNPSTTFAERAPSPTSGAVVGDTGVSFATVSWFGPESSSVQTDPSGQYQAGGLTAGQYTFTATEPGCTPASKQVTVVAGTTISVPLPIKC